MELNITDRIERLCLYSMAHVSRQEIVHIKAGGSVVDNGNVESLEWRR